MGNTGTEIEGVGRQNDPAPVEDEKAGATNNVADDDSARRFGDTVYPTDEELETLRRVHGKVDWVIYSIGVVELVERFAYYGTTAVCMSSPSWASAASCAH